MKGEKYYQKTYKNFWKGDYTQWIDYFNSRYFNIQTLIKDDCYPIIVDIGGGGGFLLKWLGVEEAVIVDISESAKEIAKRHGYKFIMGDARSIPLPDDYANTVLCFELLEHLENPKLVIQEISRILSPYGTAWIGVPNMPINPPKHLYRFTKKVFLDMISIYFNKINLFYRHALFHGQGGFWEKFAFLPEFVKSSLSKIFPNRFALMFIARCKK